MFPENIINSLPPEGLGIGLKTLIYTSILWIILAAAIMRIIVSRQQSRSGMAFGTAEIVGTAVLSGGRNTLDMITALRIEIAGNQAALKTLEQAREKGEISTRAYNELKLAYTKRIDEITNTLATYEDADIQEIEEQLAMLEAQEEELSPAELEDIEGAISSLSLEEEQLLPPKEEKPEPTPASRPPTPPAPSAPVPPSGQKPEQSKVPAPPPPPGMSAPSAPSPTPTPPAPSAPATPSASPSIPSPPAPSGPPTPSAPSPTPTPPAPSAPRMPEAPPSQIPTPTDETAPPSPVAPPPPPPPAEQKEAEQEEGVFAKSTSIAALRMEMLKELARLKKLSEFMAEQEK